MLPSASFPYIDEEVASRLLCTAEKEVKAYREEREIRLRAETHKELSETMCFSLQKAVVNRLETANLTPAFQSAERKKREGLASAMDLQREAAQQLSNLLP